jgi:hypothetical protein
MAGYQLQKGSFKFMNITSRMFSVTIVVLVILVLIFGFGWINNDVSYKYEVQDTLVAGKALDQHQKAIMHGIVFCKTASTSCLVLLVLTLIIHEVEPTFNGRIRYIRNTTPPSA